MPQIIEQQGSPIGRLGKGIGKGLADQLPKEIDRYRLSSGLDKFAKESKGKSPFQQAVDFYKIPGTTAEMGYTLFPLLQQEAKRDASEKFGKGTDEPLRKPSKPTGVNVDIVAQGDEGNLRPIPKGKIQEPKSSDQIKPLKSAEATQRQLQPIVRKTEEQLYSEAAKMSRDNPVLFPTPDDARPIVQGNENVRLANLQEERNVGNVADVVKQRLVGGIEEGWLKDGSISPVPGSQKGIPGSMRAKLLQDAETELASGKNNEQEVISKFRKAGLDIAKADTDLSAASKQKWLTSPKDTRQKINSIRKTYAEYDGLEEFQDLISENLGVSPQIAAEYAYPLNKQQKNFFEKHVPKLEPDVLSSLFIENYNPEEVKKGSVIIADDITDFIGDDHSVLSMVAEAQRKGYDPNLILKRLERNAEDGLWKPTPRQRREFQKNIPGIPSLGDMYISYQLDDDRMVE